MQVSVIIPTHNRAASLARTLRSALALDYPPDHHEIIAVDNASSSETADVVRDIQSDAGDSVVRYVREDRLGVHHARHAGAKAARGELLLFTDDDVTFSPQWATAYASTFSAHDQVAAAGGRVRPAWEVSPPDWLIEFIAREEESVGVRLFGQLSLLDLSDQLLIAPRGVFFSLNMAIRRDLLFELGGFNPEAHRGTWLGDGESGLMFKLWSRGMLIGYVPDAEVRHHIGPDRMTVGYLRRRMANQGACDVYSEFHGKVPSRKALARHAMSTAARAIRTGISAARAWNKTDFGSIHAQMNGAYEARRLTYTLRLILDNERRALVERDNWLCTDC